MSRQNGELYRYKYKLSRRTNGTYPIFNKKGT